MTLALPFWVSFNKWIKEGRHGLPVGSRELLLQLWRNNQEDVDHIGSRKTTACVGFSSTPISSPSPPSPPDIYCLTSSIHSVTPALHPTPDPLCGRWFFSPSHGARRCSSTSSYAGENNSFLDSQSLFPPPPHHHTTTTPALHGQTSWGAGSASVKLRGSLRTILSVVLLSLFGPIYYNFALEHLSFPTTAQVPNAKRWLVLWFLVK